MERRLGKKKYNEVRTSLQKVLNLRKTTHNLLRGFISFKVKEKILFPDDSEENLISLVNKWNDEDADMELYFSMKENHPFISKGVEEARNEKLSALWKAYLEQGMDFRLNYMAFNRLYCEYLPEKSRTKHN